MDELLDTDESTRDFAAEAARQSQLAADADLTDDTHAFFEALAAEVLAQL